MSEEAHKKLFGPPSDVTEPEPEQQPLAGDEKPEDDKWTTVAGGEEEPTQQTPETTEEEQKEQPPVKDDTFWRRERDALLSAVKAHDPDFADEFLQKRRGERKEEIAQQQQRAVTTAEDVAKGKAPPSENDQEYVTIGDLRREIGELKQDLHQYREQEKQARVYQQYQREYNDVNKAIYEFRQKHGITPEEHQQLLDTALTFGADLQTLGGPTAALRAYAHIATEYLKEKGGQPTPAEANVEQKVMAAKMTMQPSGAPVGLKETKEPTREQKLLDMMNKAGASQANEDVFG